MNDFDALSFAKEKKYRGILLDVPLNSDDRCQRCSGTCCSSFTDIDISWEEYQRLEELGAKRLQLSLFGPHKLEIDAGCEFLKEGRCRIYEARPDVCRRFICSET